MSKVAYIQNGREVTWQEVTTEDLLATAIKNPREALLASDDYVTSARNELRRRNIDWRAYA